MPAAAWRRSVDLPIPGSPPSRTSGPGTRPPPSTRSSSPIPMGRRGRSALADAARATGRGAAGDAGAARRPADAAARGRTSRRGCSRRRTRGIGPPSGGTTRRRTGRRSGSRARAMLSAGPPVGVRPRPGSAARRRGCRGRLRDRCRRRSWCRARTCPAGGARRGRPRPCSGSPGAAAARRKRRRSRA